MSYPTSVELCEVGPRDGFQFEEKPISTQFKLEIIRELIAAGLSRIQVASFVHPRKVPQMADAEEIIDQLGDQDGVKQRNGVRVLRSAKQRVRRCRLHDPALVHHRDTVRDNADQRQVVADEEIGESQLGLKVAKQIHHLPAMKTPRKKQVLAYKAE